MGHRRLTIIDLSDNSAQPMIGDSGKVLIYNGEIYNFRQVRRELESLGCRFRSSGDTEVLLQSLETWGADCLNKLEGMFAFVLWDPVEAEALIARDFFGIKPLYFRITTDRRLAVSSELKSFYALPDFVPEIDRNAMPEFLRFRSLCDGRTLLRGVGQVMPGQILRFRPAAGTLTESRYWRPEARLEERDADSDQEEVESFDTLFRETVKRHLIADVPVGIQFSGGVDSSLISAVVARDLRTRLKGFHCQVREKDHDETPFADEMARLLDMDVQKVVLSGETFFSPLLEKLTWYHDEPLNHPNSLGIYLVSHLAHGQVKALLSGEAADEFFGGYGRYPLLLLQDSLLKLPGMGTAAAVLSRTFGQMGGRIGTVLNSLDRNRYRSVNSQIVDGPDYIDLSDLRDLLADAHAPEESTARRAGLLIADDSLDVLTRCQVFDIQTYLPPLLLRQDKMSMAASIENRVPFVTPTIFSAALRLPPFHRASIIGRKSFLKARLTEYVPKKVVNRQKWGFGVPLHLWLRQPNGVERMSALAASNSPLSSLIDMNVVKRLVSGFDGTATKSRVLWTLLSLKVWMDIFGTRGTALAWHGDAGGAGASSR